MVPLSGFYLTDDGTVCYIDEQGIEYRPNSQMNPAKAHDLGIKYVQCESAIYYYETRGKVVNETAPEDDASADSSKDSAESFANDTSAGQPEGEPSKLIETRASGEDLHAKLKRLETFTARKETRGRGIQRRNERTRSLPPPVTKRPIGKDERGIPKGSAHGTDGERWYKNVSNAEGAIRKGSLRGSGKKGNHSSKSPPRKCTSERKPSLGYCHKTTAGSFVCVKGDIPKGSLRDSQKKAKRSSKSQATRESTPKRESASEMSTSRANNPELEADSPASVDDIPKGNPRGSHQKVKRSSRPPGPREQTKKEPSFYTKSPASRRRTPKKETSASGSPSSVVGGIPKGSAHGSIGKRASNSPAPRKRISRGASSSEKRAPSATNPEGAVGIPTGSAQSSQEKRKHMSPPTGSEGDIPNGSVRGSQKPGKRSSKSPAPRKRISRGELSAEIDTSPTTNAQWTAGRPACVERDVTTGSTNGSQEKVNYSSSGISIEEGTPRGSMRGSQQQKGKGSSRSPVRRKLPAKGGGTAQLADENGEKRESWRDLLDDGAEEDHGEEKDDSPQWKAIPRDSGHRVAKTRRSNRISKRDLMRQQLIQLTPVVTNHGHDELPGDEEEPEEKSENEKPEQPSETVPVKKPKSKFGLATVVRTAAKLLAGEKVVSLKTSSAVEMPTETSQVKDSDVAQTIKMSAGKATILVKDRIEEEPITVAGPVTGSLPFKRSSKGTIQNGKMPPDSVIPSAPAFAAQKTMQQFQINSGALDDLASMEFGIDNSPAGTNGNSQRSVVGLASYSLLGFSSCGSLS